MTIFLTALFTVLIYSLIITSIFIFSKEDEDKTLDVALGPVGWLLMAVSWVCRKVPYLNKRSIFICPDGAQRYCKLKNTNDIEGWLDGYKLQIRYASKQKWKSLKPIAASEIARSKRTCNYCAHNNLECSFNYELEECLCKGDRNYPKFSKKCFKMLDKTK